MLSDLPKITELTENITRLSPTFYQAATDWKQTPPQSDRPVEFQIHRNQNQQGSSDVMTQIISLFMTLHRNARLENCSWDLKPLNANKLTLLQTPQLLSIPLSLSVLSKQWGISNRSFSEKNRSQICNSYQCPDLGRYFCETFILLVFKIGTFLPACWHSFASSL